MAIHQHPGKDSGTRVFGDSGDLGEEVLAVLILPEDTLSFGSPDHYVVEGPGGV